jgi:hypothetical protein
LLYFGSAFFEYYRFVSLDKSSGIVNIAANQYVSLDMIGHYEAGVRMRVHAFARVWIG